MSDDGTFAHYILPQHLQRDGTMNISHNLPLAIPCQEGTAFPISFCLYGIQGHKQVTVE